jgi:hypothetical protein
MVERFLFYWVDTESGRASISGQYDLIALAHAYKAGAALTVIEFAVAWAQVALNTAIGYSVPVFAGMM